MDRSLKSYILKDLEDKIVLLMGPRYSGKTTLSKTLGLSYDYFNIDHNKDLLQVTQEKWDRNQELLILDELHKLDRWKLFLKGIYDTEGLNPKILVTGSARMEVFRRVGDSLAGRYFSHRLYPLDIQEACKHAGMKPDEAFDQLMHCSGFPEPFLKGLVTYYQRWYQTHHDVMMRQDLIDLTAVREIKSITLLSDLLKTRVGSMINYANLASDLRVSPVSIKSWIEILENMYMFFSIAPYHKNIARSILKMPKIYCFDVASVKDERAQLENFVAFSLLKRLHFLEDVEGRSVSLNYCRTKEGKEIDFCVQVDERVYLIKVKSSDQTLSKHFDVFAPYFHKPSCIQLVAHLHRPYSNEKGYQVARLTDWLADIDQHIG